jgi:acyl carrier protein
VGTLEHLEAEIKKIIVEAVVLEDVAPDQIDSSAPLFGEGLGLDSIDALEIAMALEERYGVITDDEVDLNRERFASVRNLAAYVAENRTK